MTTMNIPDVTDGFSPHADGLYAPVSPSTEVPASTPAAIAEEDLFSQWADGLRCTVRDNPLVAVAAAAATGTVLARLAR